MKQFFVWRCRIRSVCVLRQTNVFFYEATHFSSSTLNGVPRKCLSFIFFLLFLLLSSIFLYKLCATQSSCRQQIVFENWVSGEFVWVQWNLHFFFFDASHAISSSLFIRLWNENVRNDIIYMANWRRQRKWLSMGIVFYVCRPFETQHTDTQHKHAIDASEQTLNHK